MDSLDRWEKSRRQWDSISEPSRNLADEMDLKNKIF